MYTEVIQRLKVIAKRPDIARPVHVCCDMTGVGSALLEQVKTALGPYQGITVYGVSITGGEVGTWSPNRKAGPRCFNVSKTELVSTLAEVLGMERLILCPQSDRSPMENSDVLERELRAFKVKVSKTGYQGFEAMGSDHDDAVIALAVPLWVAGMRFATMSTHNTSSIALSYLDDVEDADDEDGDESDAPESREQAAIALEAKQKADAEASKRKTEQLASWQSRVDEEALRDFLDDRQWGV